MFTKLVQFAKANRHIVAAVSVAGSFAGLVFSALDLQTSLQERKRRKKLKG